MKITHAKYVGNATSLEECPRSDFPEFAFIGRSNVGKSSLINLLTNQKGLAKVSSTPGKTKLINYFNINDRLMLVDLPGYGYAKVAQGVHEGFNVAAADYLALRNELKCIFVLIDARHEPQKLDLEFFNWIQEYDRELVLTFTKADLVSKEELKNNQKLFREALDSYGFPDYPSVKTSIKNGVGKMAVFDKIQSFLPKAKKAELKKKKTSKAWLKSIGM